MKKIILSYVFVIISITGNAQDLRREIVEWEYPQVYTVAIFDFESNDVKYNCTACKVLELKTISGVTGYYISGKGKIQITGKNISENVSSCMIRFNPGELKTFIKTKELNQTTDKGFVITSTQILEKSFRHCYHDGMDALIPETKSYALNFFGDKLGEVLAGYYRNELLLYSFTEKRKL